MKKLNKLLITLFSFAVLTNWLAGGAWAGPKVKENHLPPGLAKKQTLQQPIPLAYGFVDTQKHWARQEIAKIQSQGIMKGYADNMFKPQQPVTKNEALAVIMRVVDHQGTSVDQNGLLPKVFPDWMGTAPLQAYDAGIIADWELLAWHGNKPASRLEVAMWLCRAAGEKSVAVQDLLAFAKDINQLSKEELVYLAAMYNRGIIRGTPEGYLNPLKPISRGEFAVMICRFTDSVNLTDSNPATPPAKTWIATLNPAPNQKVTVDTNRFTVKFNQPMVFAEDRDITDLTGTIKIFQYLNNKWVEADLSYTVVLNERGDELTVILDHNSVLAAQAKYCVTLPGGILQEANGTAIFPGIGKGQWSFVTEQTTSADEAAKATVDISLR
ncbi:S-layer homology domain-containing protein [Desulforamulus hydrothermalis]|uniref:S-layer domain protein n=1 Tax=Desulforamulus hydrothermalis Lam5 = DSM 18033 TaxID=1121428 RepID=K8E907_9FIRM|nr:S-layer homology domain-containing protein [Desulforamulus hydrothermalis]CCO08003.1 S-layer domain protein [Desulforamulus hydrothermalis Lam5 = DSM 18033]SHG84383.1 S-layer homology domain-containing protein [Desulforamulus hydrothermalis Lam5 = DSM 18033]